MRNRIMVYIGFVVGLLAIVLAIAYFGELRDPTSLAMDSDGDMFIMPSDDPEYEIGDTTGRLDFIFYADSSSSGVFAIQAEGSTYFEFNGKRILELCPNGDIYVKGEKTTRDIDVYKGFKEWLTYMLPDLEQEEVSDEHKGRPEPGERLQSVQRHVG